MQKKHRDLGGTVGDLKSVLHQNTSTGPKRGTLLSEIKPLHAQRGSKICAFIPGIDGMATDMMNRNMELALQKQQELVTSAGQGIVSPRMSDTKSNTRKSIWNHRASSLVSPRRKFRDVVVARCGS